jgi:hypothetical protein
MYPQHNNKKRREKINKNTLLTSKKKNKKYVHNPLLTRVTHAAGAQGGI